MGRDREEAGRHYVYQQELGRRGISTGTAANNETFQQTRQAESLKSTNESIMRSLSTPAPSAPVSAPIGPLSGPPAAPPLGWGSGSSTGLPSTGVSRRSRPKPVPSPWVRWPVLAFFLSGIGALVWSLATDDDRPIETWWNGFLFCLRTVATGLGLVMSQVIALGIEAYLVVRPVIAVIGGQLLALSPPWAFGVGIAGIIALIVAFRVLRRLFARMPKGWRLVSVGAVVASPVLFLGSSWWFWHQLFTDMIIQWGQNHLGWMFLGQ